MIERIEDFLEFGGIKKDITLLVISGIALLISLFVPSNLPFNLAWIAIILCGIPIILEAIIGLVTEFDIKADVLVSLALIASVCIGEDFAAGEVAFIMQLGGLLEELTVARAQAGIEKLVQLTPQTARIIKNGKEQIVDAKEVCVGDKIRVLPGETIAVDGVITSGQTSINQAVMTGESLPVDKTVGDEVSSGTVNQYGAFEMKATKVGEDSSIQRMIRLVQSASADKAEIVGIADRWATWIVVIALSAALLTWLFTGEIIRAVTILVVFCPCALVLATPTAIMAAIGNATKHGFLVREGDALERLAKVTKITFDKTGTLTFGTFHVEKVQSFIPEITDQQLYGLCASVEQLSEHPLGKAIVSCFKEDVNQELFKVKQFKMIPGQGIKGLMDQKMICAGNQKMMDENGIAIHDSQQTIVDELVNKGCTVIYISLDDQLAGYIALADTIRPQSAKMIDQLHHLQVEPVLLTGDHANTASYIAEEVHIQEVHAQCLPEDKLHQIYSYQKQGDSVCMIGDGINDAPALKASDIGIAMGAIGSDIAVDAADIVLVDDEIKELPHLVSLSKKMMTTIKINMSFSMGLNFVAIVLAITGILNPIVGALVHNAGSVLVIINSALLLNWREKE